MDLLEDLSAKLLQKVSEVSTSDREMKVKLVLNQLSTFEQIRQTVCELADQKLLSNRKNFKTANDLYREADIYLKSNSGKLAVKCLTEALRNCPFPNAIQSNDIQEKNLLANCYQKRSQAFALLGEETNASFDQNQSQYLLDIANNGDTDAEQQGLSHKRQKTAISVESETYQHMNLKIEPYKGRCFRAEHEIQAGECVLKEKPLAAVLDDCELKNFCSNCLKEADVCFWPCRDCNEVVFCSRECERIAINTYHRFECGIARLLSKESTIHGYLAYRLVTVVGCDVALKLNRELLNGQLTAEWIVSMESKSVDLIVTYKAFLTLYDHLDSVDTKTECSELVHCIYLAIFMQYKNAYVFEMRRESDGSYKEEDLSTFIDMVLLIHSHINKLHINCFEYTDENADQEWGSAVMYLGSIFSHSCDCNVDYKWINEYLVFSTNSEIFRAEELTISYGPVVQSGGVLKRRKKLRQEYHFDCRCLSCVTQYSHIKGIKCVDCNGFVDYNESTDQGFCLSCYTLTNNYHTVIDSINALKSQIQALVNTLMTLRDVDDCVRDIDVLLNQLKDQYLHETSDYIIETTNSVSVYCLVIRRFDLAFNMSLKIFGKHDRPEDYTGEEFQRLIALTEYCGEYVDNNDIVDRTRLENLWHFRLAMHDLIIEIIRCRRSVAPNNDELVKLKDVWQQNKKSTQESMNRSLRL